MEIRAFKKEDYNQVVVLVTKFQDYISSLDKDNLAKNFNSVEDAKKYTDKLLQDVEEMEGFFFVAEEEGKILGFVDGVIERYREDNTFYFLTHEPGDTGWIGVIIVDEGARGKGIARQLFEKAKEYIKSKGCNKVKLLVLKDNINAVQIYEKLGFVIHDLEMSLDI